ncbi:MAG TPA: tetratricopeptide repeat protein [Candidatus Eisenbacteria bacterium]|nr:tetratricopeptide repeat protein [Candidatus Eisenbacteria bacterium]
MAPATRRLSRKEIRQPDKFITLTRSLYEGIRVRRLAALAVAAVIALAVAAVLGWQLYIGRQNALAAKEFNRGVALFRGQEYKAAIEAFDKASAYRWSDFYGLALLYETNSYLALNDLDQAIETGRSALRSAPDDPLVRQGLLLALAHAEERKGLCPEAVQHYTEAEKIRYRDANVSGPFQERALLGRARCSAQLGDFKGAIGAYREYLKQSGTDQSGYVSARIAELEAKLAAEPTAKPQ